MVLRATRVLGSFPEDKAIVMRAGREFLDERESGFARVFIRRFFRDNHLLRRPQAAEGFRPIDDRDPPAGFQHARRFDEYRVLVADLEQEIRDEHEIEDAAELGAAFLFQITREYLDVGVSVLLGIVLDTTQQILLDIDRIDGAAPEERS